MEPVESWTFILWSFRLHGLFHGRSDVQRARSEGPQQTPAVVLHTNQVMPSRKWRSSSSRFDNVRSRAIAKPGTFCQALPAKVVPVPLPPPTAAYGQTSRSHGTPSSANTLGDISSFGYCSVVLQWRQESTDRSAINLDIVHLLVHPQNHAYPSWCSARGRPWAFDIRQTYLLRLFQHCHVIC